MKTLINYLILGLVVGFTSWSLTKYAIVQGYEAGCQDLGRKFVEPKEVDRLCKNRVNLIFKGYR